MTATQEKSIVDSVPRGLFIGGEWRDASGGETLDVEDPSTGETLVEVADANVPGPFDLAFVRHEFSGDDIHEGGFSFAVGTDKADVFAF